MKDFKSFPIIFVTFLKISNIMTFEIEDLENTLQKFGDQSVEYTEEEEQAMSDLYEMIDSKFDKCNIKIFKNVLQ